ncbi:hypothetical protein G6F63_016029 [Rhizopus arrhizus]|nr:hypothetical protein G6F63_016029 [Rhizopus arrhizus]
MRDYADRIQLELQRVPDVGKIDLVGLQDEKVWIELSNTRLATLGVSMQQLLRDRHRSRAAARDRPVQRYRGDPPVPDPCRRPHRAPG